MKIYYNTIHNWFTATRACFLWLRPQCIIALWLVSICFFFGVLRGVECYVNSLRCLVHENESTKIRLSDDPENFNSQMDEANPSTTKEFFRHTTQERNSSYPFISGDTFRAMADHVFDETTDVNEWSERIQNISSGDVVFLGTEVPLLKFFGKNIFEKIRHPFVLITHNSDLSVPTTEFRWVLDHEKILAWFASNPDYVHKKLVPIPIGLANRRWTHGNLNAFERAFYRDRKPFFNRMTLLYVNFEVKNNAKARAQAVKWAHKVFNVTQIPSTSHEVYLKELGNAKYVLSPPGNGLDCHRTWEAILMGAVPIVLRSRLDPLFFNSQVLVVDDWNYITMEYLRSLDHNGSLNQMVFAKYWKKRIFNVAKRHFL